jgi:hypothetical protein
MHRAIAAQVSGRLLGGFLAILLFQFIVPLINVYAAPTPPRYTTSALLGNFLHQISGRSTLSI